MGAVVPWSVVYISGVVSWLKLPGQPGFAPGAHSGACCGSCRRWLMRWVDLVVLSHVRLAQEFIAAALNRQEALNAKTLAEVFDKLDDDDDGEIGARALSCALQVSACRLVLSVGCWLSSRGHAVSG